MSLLVSPPLLFHYISGIIFNYFPFILGGSLMATWLNGGRFIETVIILNMLSLIVYGLHRLIHRVNVPIFTNLHKNHHKTGHTSWIDLLIEIVFNLLISGGIFFYFVPVRYHPLLIFHALSYTSIHIISYASSDTHNDHHIDTSTNYGPDYLDWLFSTKKSPTMENMTPLLLNLVVIFLMLRSLYF
jgi:hypothetical protein